MYPGLRMCSEDTTITIIRKTYKYIEFYLTRFLNCNYNVYIGLPGMVALRYDTSCVALIYSVLHLSSRIQCNGEVSRECDGTGRDEPALLRTNYIN
jgi:hypothetical protein